MYFLKNAAKNLVFYDANFAAIRGAGIAIIIIPDATSDGLWCFRLFKRHGAH